MGDHGQGVVSEVAVAIPEQRALAAGVTRLHELLVARRQAEIFDFPRRPDGSCQLLAGSFIRRLLSGELELKGCVEADVSAAQPDLKLLSTEQLLAIRVNTLTFSTDSEAHRAHSSFTATTDALLLETLGRRLLRECQVPSCEGPPSGEPPTGAAGPTAPRRPVAAELLRRLGLRVVQVCGVVEACKSGWCSSVAGRGEEELSPLARRLRRLSGSTVGEARGGTAELPACWAFELDQELWPGAQAVVINAEELWAAPTAGLPGDFAALAAGAEIVVPRDQSTGVGKDRQLRWEMCVLDPKRHDVLARLRGSDHAGDLAKAQLHLGSELRAALERRREACPDKSWQPTPRTAKDEGSPDSAPATVAPRWKESHPAYHGGKYTGVLGHRRHRSAVSPRRRDEGLRASSSSETAFADESLEELRAPSNDGAGSSPAPPDLVPGSETAFADESLEELRAPSDDGAGSSPASTDLVPDLVLPRRRAPREETAEAPAQAAAAQDWSLWSYFDFWGSSSAPEPAPVVEVVEEPAPVVPSAGPPRLRVRERRRDRGLCGIDANDMCGEVEVVEVEGDRSLYKVPQAYPDRASAPASPGRQAPPGGAGLADAGLGGGGAGGASALLGQAGI